MNKRYRKKHLINKFPVMKSVKKSKKLPAFKVNVYGKSLPRLFNTKPKIVHKIEKAIKKP